MQLYSDSRPNIQYVPKTNATNVTPDSSPSQTCCYDLFYLGLLYIYAKANLQIYLKNNYLVYNAYYVTAYYNTLKCMKL